MLIEKGVKDVPRSRIFKGRPVILKLQVPTRDVNELYEWSFNKRGKPPADDGNFTTLSEIVLTEVTTIKEEVSGGVGQTPGVIAAILQMWYLSPITITVTGKSYMGMFVPTSLGVGGSKVGVDSDIEQLLDFRSSINSFFHQTTFPKDMRFKLIYGNSAQDAGGTVASQSFIGYIDALSIDEGDDKPGLRDYSFKFIGEESSHYSILRGQQEYANDAKDLRKKTIQGAGPSVPYKSNTESPFGENPVA
jgi:hypothetical protein